MEICKRVGWMLQILLGRFDLGGEEFVYVCLRLRTFELLRLDNSGSSMQEL